MSNTNQELINGLMDEVVGKPSEVVQMATKDEIQETISNIFKQYNLSTDTEFVAKIASLKFGDKDEKISFDEFPDQLQNAAFLPVDTMADLALRNDLDLVISQIPEWFVALQITRDAVCESDVVTGRLARSIIFDHSDIDDIEKDNIIKKIEQVEEKLEIDSIVKNHIVFNSLEYGESYVYAIPYAKVFQDLYKYRMMDDIKKKNSKYTSVSSMFQSSSPLSGYGYCESVEVKLSDTVSVVNAASSKNKTHKKSDKQSIFTESEIINLYPMYHNKENIKFPTEHTERIKTDDDIDSELDIMCQDIRYIEEDVALPVIEESPHDLKCLYETKYKNRDDFVQEANSVFEAVINNQDDNIDGVMNEFQNIRGIYLRIIPSTKLIPIRIDREIIGYYYISDMTRPEESGDRKNSKLTGYTFRAPTTGYDSFSPDQIMCERLATKIINNFNLKFMRDNISLHKQIVSILMAHKFNEALLRFVFIPAEHIQKFAINKDGMGKGHSMLEPGLVTARMYMFLKLYSLLYQINNSQVRVYNLHLSGIDKNYKQFVQQTMRKFAARRITANDIFNYGNSMPKVSGGSELVMPMGPNDRAPITVETIPAAEAPINNDLLESFKNEAINSTPVPSLMVQTGGQSEIEFAKETELANTRFNTLISSCKVDFNPDLTRFIRLILRWETDIEPSILKTLRYVLRMPMAKQLNVTNEMLTNYESLANVLVKTCLTKEERKGSSEDGESTSDIEREFRKQILAEYIPQIDIEHFEQLANEARKIANKKKLLSTNKEENILNEENPEM